MTASKEQDAIDIAMLPLADGRRMMMPMNVLAEVKQLPPVGEAVTEHGQLHWRGYDLPINSLDEECGLPAPPVQRQRIVGIFRAAADSNTPFRALAFCGTAAHGRIQPNQLASVDLPPDGSFAAAAELDGELYLIPDLASMLYGEPPAQSPQAG